MSWLRKEEQLQGTPQAAGGAERMVKGIDVSHYQKGIDWNAVAADGVKFAFAKATDGALGFDGEFNSHRQRAKENGLIFGSYHFFRFEEDLAEQARNFLKAVGDTKGELPPVIDVEWDKHSTHYGEGTMMDNEAADRVWAFLAIVTHSLGFYPMIYTNPYFWSPGKRSESFKPCPLWVPNYGAKDISGVKVPSPWSKIDFWQYSESIHAYGVDKVDGNWFMGDEAALRKLVRQ